MEDFNAYGFDFDEERAKEILQGSFSVNEPFSIDSALDVLRKSGAPLHGVNSEKEAFMFFEQFTSFLRPDHESGSLSLFDPDEAKELYDDAVNIMHDMGYAPKFGSRGQILTELQECAFRDKDFWDNSRILIMGNTSSGKTAVSVVKFIHDINNKNGLNKMLIAVPYRALAMQMYESLNQHLSKYDLTICVSTSEISDDDEDIKQGNPDIAIVIYEKLFIFLSKKPDMLGKYDHLTLDEIGILQSEERGIKADYLIAQVTNIPNFNITLLATPYFNYTEYEEKYGFHKIMLLSRPVPVEEYFFLPKRGKNNIILYYQYDSSGKELRNSRPEFFESTLINFVLQEFNDNKKIIVFHFSTKTVSERAKKFASELKVHITKQERDEFKRRFCEEYDLVEEELYSTFNEDWQYDALMLGVTFHHASLPESLRMAIEQELLGTPKVIKGGIKLVFATETLAYGINGNVDTVFITSIKKRDSTEYRMLSVNEYQNCIGRSGRLGYTTYGRSYCFLNPLEDSGFKSVKEYITHYTGYSPKNSPIITSKLREMINADNWSKVPFLLLSIIPSDGITVTEILRILGGANSEEMRGGVCRTLDYLETNGFIKQSFSPFSSSGENKYVTLRDGDYMRGCLISVETYDKMKAAYRSLPRTSDGVFYIMDICRMIADLDEMFVNCAGIIPKVDISLRPKKQEETRERAKNESYSVVGLWRSLPQMQTGGLLDDNWISDKLFAEIDQSNYFKHAERKNELNDRLFDELIKTAISIITMLWVQGYSESLIGDIICAGNTTAQYLKIDNIKRRSGEKMSYLIDIFKAVAKVCECTPQEEEFLAQLSLSAFYGIRLDLLREREIDLLDDEQSRRLHIESITGRRNDINNTRFLNERRNDNELV